MLARHSPTCVAAPSRAPPQIDPWGHTAFQATYMSSPLAGFNAVYYGRIDWEEAQQRKAARTAEAVWAPSASLGLSAATLGGCSSGKNL